MNHYTLLIVDDEPGIRNNLKTFLERYHFTILEAATGTEAIEQVRTQQVDVVILDLMLPDIYGIDVCKQIRSLHPTMPILFLTAVSDDTETVLGFEAGGDDYIEKPFNPHVLLARIKTKLKNHPHARTAQLGNRQNLTALETHRCIHFGKWQYYPNHSRVVYDNQHSCHLTDKENALLKLLLSDPSRVFSRNEIASHLNLASDGDIIRDVNIHVHRLRNKLTRRHNAISPIKAVRARGYTMDGYLHYHYESQPASQGGQQQS